MKEIRVTRCHGSDLPMDCSPKRSYSDITPKPSMVSTMASSSRARDTLATYSRISW